MRTTKIWRGLKFTADTNCGINYQAGFDECGCPGDPNTLLTESEISKLRDGNLNSIGDMIKVLKTSGYMIALAGVRRLFRGPDKCVTGTEKMSVYQGNAVWDTVPCGETCSYITNSIKYMRAAVNDWHLPRGESDYVAAYNTVIGEYNDYYNAHCILPETPSPSSGGSTSAGGSSGGSPASAPPSTGGSGGSTTSASSTPTTNGSASPAQPNIAGKTIGGAIKKVPLWAWLVGGGLVATIVIVAIVKK